MSKLTVGEWMETAAKEYGVVEAVAMAMVFAIAKVVAPTAVPEWKEVDFKEWRRILRRVSPVLAGQDARLLHPMHRMGWSPRQVSWWGQAWINQWNATQPRGGTVGSDYNDDPGAVFLLWMNKIDYPQGWATALCGFEPYRSPGRRRQIAIQKIAMACGEDRRQTSFWQGYTTSLKTAELVRISRLSKAFLRYVACNAETWNEDGGVPMWRFILNCHSEWREISSADRELLQKGRIPSASWARLGTKGFAVIRDNLWPEGWSDKLRVRAAWQWMLGTTAPTGAQPHDCLGVKPKEWELALADKEVGANEAAQLPAARLLRVFGTWQRVQEYVQRYWSGACSPIHNAGQFTLPRSGWTAGPWAGLALRFGPEILRMGFVLDQLEAGGVPTSLAGCRRKLASLPQGLAFLLGISEENWEDYEEVLGRAVPGPLPVMELGRADSYALTVLSHEDPRGPALGRLTDCCQHLHGAGQECAEHGTTSSNGGFVVVTDDHDEIIAQSWYWVDGKGGLCFDNVECKGGFASRQEVIINLYNQATAWLLENGYSKVTMGTGYLEIETPWKKANKPLVPCDYHGYRDSKNQLLLGKKEV